MAADPGDGGSQSPPSPRAAHSWAGAAGRAESVQFEGSGTVQTSPASLLPTRPEQRPHRTACVGSWGPPGLRRFGVSAGGGRAPVLGPSPCGGRAGPCVGVRRRGDRFPRVLSSPAALRSCHRPRGARNRPWGRPPGSGRLPSGSHLSRNKTVHAIASENSKVRNPSRVKGPLTRGLSLEDPGRRTRDTGQSRF